MKKITVTAFSSLAIIGFLFFCAPPLLHEKAPKVHTQTLHVRDVYEIVSCQGTVDSENKEGLSTGTPAEVLEICVSKGDRVAKGQLLMRYRLLTSEEISSIGYANLYLGELAEMAKSAYNELNSQSLFAAILMYGTTGEIPAFLSDYYLPHSSSHSPATYGELRAGISGMVVDINHSVEDKISGAWDSFCILDTGSLIAKINVPEAYASKIKVGQSVNISGNALNGKVLGGTVSEIMPYAETIGGIFTSQSTVVPCTVKINDPQGLLRQGNSIKAQIFCSKYSNTFLIPYECISQDANGKEFVYVYYKGRAYKRTITALFENDKGMVPQEPFFEGVELVIHPSDNLYNACKVTRIGEEAK